MIGFSECSYDPFEYEMVRARQLIDEPELQRRTDSSRATLVAFIALLEDGDAGSLRKLSLVEKVEEETEGSGVYVIEFDLLHPVTEKKQTSSSSYFRNGLYQGQTTEGTSLYIPGERGRPGVSVTSGFFTNLPKTPVSSDILDAWRDRRNSSPI